MNEETAAAYATYKSREGNTYEQFQRDSVFDKCGTKWTKSGDRKYHDTFVDLMDVDADEESNEEE
jgi:hypothetical protein